LLAIAAADLSIAIGSRASSVVSSLDLLNASGVAKVPAGFFIALSMSIATYDSALATLGAISTEEHKRQKDGARTYLTRAELVRYVEACGT
jgi:hypothetical protein